MTNEQETKIIKLISQRLAPVSCSGTFLCCFFQTFALSYFAMVSLGELLVDMATQLMVKEDSISTCASYGCAGDRAFTVYFDTTKSDSLSNTTVHLKEFQDNINMYVDCVLVKGKEIRQTFATHAGGALGFGAVTVFTDDIPKARRILEPVLQEHQQLMLCEEKRMKGLYRPFYLVPQGGGDVKRLATGTGCSVFLEIEISNTVMAHPMPASALRLSSHAQSELDKCIRNLDAKTAVVEVPAKKKDRVETQIKTRSKSTQQRKFRPIEL